MRMPRANLDIGLVHIYPGEVLTVMLHDKPLCDGGGRMIQVEVRVLPNGTCQAFASGLEMQPWSKWYSVETGRMSNDEK